MRARQSHSLHSAAYQPSRASSLRRRNASATRPHPTAQPTPRLHHSRSLSSAATRPHTAAALPPACPPHGRALSSGGSAQPGPHAAPARPAAARLSTKRLREALEGAGLQHSSVASSEMEQ
jgi:hypothetical protein